ncbi:hypothetical protein IX38_22625 [Chryseobacterium luteum]|uniref:Uncharacterized protein n=1 Tax=Chryseobacterium luteum TaxID=421531 RepID=A0A085YXK3_9FLAO|nr:hypothetical protein IX38_22625 [Chryseobacterium luteum]
MALFIEMSISLTHTGNKHHYNHFRQYPMAKEKLLEILVEEQKILIFELTIYIKLITQKE